MSLGKTFKHLPYFQYSSESGSICSTGKLKKGPQTWWGNFLTDSTPGHNWTWLWWISILSTPFPTLKQTEKGSPAHVRFTSFPVGEWNEVTNIRHSVPGQQDAQGYKKQEGKQSFFSMEKDVCNSSVIPISRTQASIDADQGKVLTKILPTQIFKAHLRQHFKWRTWP